MPVYKTTVTVTTTVDVAIRGNAPPLLHTTEEDLAKITAGYVANNLEDLQATICELSESGVYISNLQKSSSITATEIK